MPTRPCRICGDPRLVSTQSLAEPTCQPCRRLAPKQKRRPPPSVRTECSRCHRELARSRTSRPVIVCRPCRKKQPEPYRIATARRCGWCADQLLPKQPKFCSRICSAHAGNDGPGMDRSRRNHRTRARYYGVKYQPVNANDLYARDNWTCGLCAEPIDPRRQWPDQMCPSLDHITPMSKGGDHIPANIQAAHWLCNVLKGSDESITFRLHAA